MQEAIPTVLQRLESWGRGRQWIGPDPYEGLNSPLGRIAPGRRPKQAVTQAYKRLPVMPPWPLSAAARPNAVALAHVLSAYATPTGRSLPGAEEYLGRLPRALAEMSLDSNDAAWGYPFDVQTRNIRYDSRTPNAIATSFVVAALCDLHAATGDEAAANLALAARPFLLSLLHQGQHGPFFAYVPAGSALVHNANLLVCGALTRLQAIDADKTVEGSVCGAAATTIHRQREDGLWRYGEASGYGWVDSFHTAYLLEGLWRVNSTFDFGAEALRHGLLAWKRGMFEPDGWARYYSDRHFPLDAQCCAAAIELLCLTADAPDLELAAAIAELAARELWIEDEGRFAFRRTRRGVNRREFMRWTNAPMFSALAGLSSDTRRTSARRDT